MDIAVISDLHLGAGDKADSFGHDDAQFLRFLDFLEGNFEKVVLLGDVWETLQPKVMGNPKFELELAKRAHPQIAKRFLLPQYHYVHGNHDVIAGSLGVPEELTLSVDGARFLFVHGHQNDDLIRDRPWLADMGIWLGGWIRRVGLQAFYDFCQKIDEARGGQSLDSTRCAFQRWAIENASVREVDVVITGHTHKAARAEHGHRLYLNSGSCSEGEFSFLSMDTKRGAYAVNQTW